MKVIDEKEGGKRQKTTREARSYSFNLRKKRFSEASRLKVGYSLSFSNLEVYEIIS